MADFVFNVAKGKAGHYATLPGADDSLIVVLLQSVGIDSDATMIDLDTLALVVTTSDEATFTNYARKTAASVLSTVDDTNDRLDADFADLTWTAAGGAANNTLAKLVVAYKPTAASADTAVIPLTAHDFSVTTDGSDLIAQVATAGFYRAA